MRKTKKAMTRKRIEEVVYATYVENQYNIATRDITDTIAEAVWNELTPADDGEPKVLTGGRCKELFEFPNGTLRCTKDASHHADGSAHFVNPRFGHEVVVQGDIFDDFLLVIQPAVEDAMCHADIDGYGDEGQGYDYVKLIRHLLDNESLTEFYNIYFERRGVSDE